VLVLRTVAIVSERSSSVLKTLRQEGDFLVAHIMADVATGDTMDRLPPHITLLQPFRTLGATAVSGFIETLGDVEALEAHVGERHFGESDYFGEKNDILVRPVVGEGALSLMAIHVLFLARFRPFIKSDLKYAGQRYRPHMTIQSNSGDSDPGEKARICVDSACLLRKSEGGGYMVYSADRFKNVKE